MIKRDGKDSKKGLRDSGLTINKPFPKIDSWTLNLINERGLWMKDSILKMRSAAWVESGNLDIAQWKPTE
jgi:hypothetical protein